MTSGGARIHLCGGLRAELAGERREDRLHGRQGRLLFAFLILRRHRPVTRDELVEAVWGHGGLPPSDGALAPVLSRLRRAIAPAAVAGRDGLLLHLPEPAWIDIEAARTALLRARETNVQEEKLATARQAVALVEPGLLPGLDAPWLTDERAGVDHLRVEALELAAQAALGLDPPLAETLSRSAVAASPFRESAWAALIRALRARGNVAEALQAYDEIRCLLRDELGAVPGRELVTLHGQLLAADSDTHAATPAPPSADTVRPPRRTAAGGELIEREEELRAVEGALDRLIAGEGGLVLFEGPAGIGKTRLLDELRVRAEERQTVVLQARAGLLEREFAFGVVRQLCEPVANPALFEGPAAAARAVLSDVGISEGTFPVLNGLFRFVESLATSQPLTICIDDLQWSDAASLRFMAYLARRIADLPVLIAATVRTGEPDADEALLAELAQEPVAQALSPRPLTVMATRQFIARRLGRDPDAAFMVACHEVTAGNPLLLHQLLRAVAAEGITPDASQAPAVRAIGPRAVARTVLLRLSRVAAPAVSVARAVAVLGEQPGLPAIAALAGVDEATAGQALQALARAEILRHEEPLGFVHPLIRDAVYHELPPAARALEHERAARILAGLGVSPERVAAQLLLTAPRGDAWVVSRLREAAALARRRGAPDAAMRLLERAQVEPPTSDQQAALAFELGGSAAFVRGPAGVAPLEQAYVELTDPSERAQAALRLSHLLLFVRSPQEGVALSRRAAEELPGEPQYDDVRCGLRSIRLIGAAFGAVDPAEFRELTDVRHGPRGGGPGARALTAMASLALALTCEPAIEASALAREAFAGGLDTFELTAPIALGSAALALGEPSEGLDSIRAYAEFARRHGEILSSIGADLWGGLNQIWAGDLPAAVALLERAYEGERLWGTKLDAVMAYSAAFTALAQLERGDPSEEVAATLHRVQARDPRPDGARFWLASLAELALADGRPADALAVTRRLEPTRPPETHPVWAPWRSLRARALAALGQPEEAQRLANEELSLAQRIGSGWVIGRGLRILAELCGPDRLELAREAVAQLTPTSARLELAKAQLTLADALVTAGESAAAAEAARTATELAEACGAVALAQRARSTAGAGTAEAPGRPANV